MGADSIDELVAWGKESSHDFGWWKTARTFDDRLVLAMPPHDSLYVAEIYRDGEYWVVRHGDSSDASTFKAHQLPGRDEPATLLEKLSRALIADASSLLDSNPDWASVLGECVLTIAEPLKLGYLKIAGVETLTRASEIVDRTPVPSTVEPVRVIPVPPPYSPSTGIAPQAPLQNEYFSKPAKAPSSGARGTGKGGGLAVASLVLGIVGYLLLYTWFSVVIALAAIGAGFAVIVQNRPARVLGWIGLGLGCVCLFVAVALLLGARRPGSLY
ncbi:hypothetical protein [Microcella sp.]|uniref:hypothetical protein n=1 Tax=Microcella sp. TaxID=1913979 RepID=UPI003F728EF0